MFKRFPRLKERFYSAVIQFFRYAMDPTTKLVTQIVNAEGCYINTAHPSFIGGHRALASVTDKLQLKPATPTGPGSVADKKAGSHAAPTYNLDQKQEGIFGSFFSGKKTTRHPGVLEPPPQVLKASGSVSEREYIEIEVIKTLLTSYFDIVKCTLTDMVPKCIMLNLVFHAREEMQRSLLAEFYREELLGELLEESPETVARRKECQKMIKALQAADTIVSSI